MSKGTCCDILRAASDLENRARDLTKFSDRPIDVHELQVDIKFSVNTVNITDIKQLFGTLVTPRMDDKIQDTAETHAVTPQMDITLQGAAPTYC